MAINFIRFLLLVVIPQLTIDSPYRGNPLVNSTFQAHSVSRVTLRNLTVRNSTITISGALNGILSDLQIVNSLNQALIVEYSGNTFLHNIYTRNSSQNTTTQDLLFDTNAGLNIDKLIVANGNGTIASVTFNNCQQTYVAQSQFVNNQTSISLTIDATIGQTDLTMVSSIIDHNADIALTTDQSINFLKLIGCTITNNANGGVTTYANNTLIDSCTFTNNTGIAINVQAGSNCSINGNTIVGNANGTNGVYIPSGSNYWRITNNDISHYTDGNAIQVGGGTNHLIQGNNLSYNDIGVYSNASTSQICNNQFTTRRPGLD